MKKIILTLIIALTVQTSFSLEPINPNTTENAKSLLNYLDSIQGKQMLAGQHLTYGKQAKIEINYIFEQTKKYPALVEFEAGIFETKYHEDYTRQQDELVKDVIDYRQKGGIIGICWHWGNPLKPRNTYENTKVKFDIKAALQEGTPENEAMLKDLDITAKMLKELQEAGVPILWRPLHEICGGWFWWSMQGSETAQELWKFIYHYYTDHHQLNNLLWVYSASQEMKTEWFPGLEYADVIGVDIYLEDQKDKRKNYDIMASIAGDKPIALSECDIIPDPTIMKERGFLWNWFLPWNRQWIRSNEPKFLRYVYHHELVITLDELPEF